MPRHVPCRISFNCPVTFGVKHLGQLSKHALETARNVSDFIQDDQSAKPWAPFKKTIWSCWMIQWSPDDMDHQQKKKGVLEVFGPFLYTWSQIHYERFWQISMATLTPFWPTVLDLCLDRVPKPFVGDVRSDHWMHLSFDVKYEEPYVCMKTNLHIPLPNKVGGWKDIL